MKKARDKIVYLVVPRVVNFSFFSASKELNLQNLTLLINLSISKNLMESYKITSNFKSKLSLVRITPFDNNFESQNMRLG